MESTSVSSTHRFGVMVNYTAIALVVVLFYVGKYHAWSLPVIIGLCASAGLVVVGFVRLHLGTRRWNLTHAKTEKLDERELQVTLKSLKHAYVIFTITSIIAILILALLAGHHDSMLMLVCISLVYLAHTLPSSVIAWRGREV